MSDAWTVRPKPHGTNRLDEFLEQKIVAIGWPGIGDLTTADRGEIRTRAENTYDWGNHKLGTAVGQIDSFVNKISEGDYILVPAGSDVYIATVTSEYDYEESLSSEDEGYPHHRDVEWKFGGSPISRSSLPGQLHDTLKCQLTVFSADGDAVKSHLESEVVVREQDASSDLQAEYRERLQAGDIPGINSNSFEGEVVRLVLDNYFPGLNREATSSDDTGDTDLIAELPGGVTVRIQVKHFYSDHGELGAAPVKQLAASMTNGDHGVVVTSTDIGSEAEAAAEESEHDIGLIGGEKFVDLLFEDLQNYSEEELYKLGLQEQPPAIRLT